MKPPVVRETSFDTFQGMEREWERLRDESGGDPLFMSWTWLSTWWEVFGDPAGAEWICLVIEDGQGGLAGAAALFRHRGASRGPIRIRKLSVVGGFVRAREGVLSQYAELLGDFDGSPKLLSPMLDHLSGRLDWSELSLGLVPRDSDMLRALRSEASARRWHLRERGSVPSHVVEMRGTFQEYCATRAPSVRRRLVNERRRLAALGEATLEYVDASRAEQTLQLMNRLRAARSGEPAFSPRALEFHLRLIPRLSPTALRLTKLSLAGEPISVNYALRMGNREYGVAMGFDHGLDGKVSLGTLHLGYALEDAWRDGVGSYDLMTSTPGTDAWKVRLADTSVELVNLQVVRNPVLGAMYRWHDRASLARGTQSRRDTPST
jgi:hypothetical protein